MLSYVFAFMIAASVLCSVFLGTTKEMSDSLMSGAQQAVELIVTMSGMMCLWSGVMEVAKESRLTNALAKAFSPILRKLFPDVKKDSVAFECISMNVAANLLGLGNAATPLGLKAMKELKGDCTSVVATDAMITFVVMNTSSIQLLPTTIATMRSALGSDSPFDIVICVWITSVVALALGLSVAKILCKRGEKVGANNAVRDSVCADIRAVQKG
ncbi:MAG: spore maturation protein A [Ruminococcus sp.]|nr:spore maturation protein A [Ruminococcus sp.]